VLRVPGGQRPEAGEFGIELVFGAFGASAFGGGEWAAPRFPDS